MGDYSTSHAVHIFGDSGRALTQMRLTAEAAGCRIVSIQRLGETCGFSAPGAVNAAILIELNNGEAGEAVLSLLDWAHAEAERGARRCVVSAPEGLIDLVAARAWHRDVLHLCAATEEERLAAVVRIGRPREARLRDPARETARLLQPSPGYAAHRAGPADARFIRAMLRVRRLRARFLPGDLFADPAWDMLLDLMAARLEGKQVAVSSLCIAAAVPPTTALRWLGVLVEEGLVIRVADPADGRRVNVALAEPAAQALGAWLDEARRLSAETA